MEKDDVAAYVPILCPRCKRSNSPDAKYCNGCGLAFDLKYAIEVDEDKKDVKEKVERLASELAKSPHIVDALLNALSTLKNETATENVGTSNAQNRSALSIPLQSQ